MQFLKAVILFLFKGKPPIFSSSEIISLKSPKRIQGKDTTVARFCKYSQKNLRLLKLEEAYVAARLSKSGSYVGSLKLGGVVDRRIGS